MKTSVVCRCRNQFIFEITAVQTATDAEAIGSTTLWLPITIKIGYNISTILSKQNVNKNTLEIRITRPNKYFLHFLIK